MPCQSEFTQYTFSLFNALSIHSTTPRCWIHPETNRRNLKEQLYTAYNKQIEKNMQKKEKYSMLKHGRQHWPFAFYLEGTWFACTPSNNRVVICRSIS
jgi:hypothetical protein